LRSLLEIQAIAQPHERQDVATFSVTAETAEAAMLQADGK